MFPKILLQKRYADKMQISEIGQNKNHFRICLYHARRPTAWSSVSLLRQHLPERIRLLRIRQRVNLQSNRQELESEVQKMTLTELTTAKIIDSSLRIMEYDDDEDEFKVIIEFDYLTAQNLNAIPETLQKREVDYIVPSYDGLLKIDIILAK